MARPSKARAQTGHEMTVEDWKALYIVQQLARQICLYGKGRKAIRLFAKAVLEGGTDGSND